MLKKLRLKNLFTKNSLMKMLNNFIMQVTKFLTQKPDMVL